MLEVHLLGTGGTMPLPERPLTALLVRCEGKSLLIDCGEGTQTAIRQLGLGMKPIDTILFTHFHADHIAGIPGFLLTMGKQGRTEPVTIIGPQGLCHYVKSLLVIAPELPFELQLIEIESEEQIFSLGKLKITAFSVNHSVPCFSYTIELERAGKFDPEKARLLGIEPPLWGKIQRGETLDINGILITPEMIMGSPRKGLKITYCTDTRPTESITEHAKNSDLFICEGMYADENKLDRAVEKKHMLFCEAAQTAKSACVERLWLTHYSPSLTDPTEYSDSVRSIFPKTEIPLKHMSTELFFND